MPIAKKPKSKAKKTHTEAPKDVESFINQGFEEAEVRLRHAGLLLEDISLDLIDEGYFTRDRIVHDDVAFAELRSSILKNGQKTPIEVTVVSEPGEPLRYGLVSGWRRLHAIRELFKEGVLGFATVNARVLHHDVSSALVAQAIENEVRKDISPFERAIFIDRTIKAGAFENVGQAVKSMYGQASAAKQSKIKSMVKLVRYIGDVVRHPDNITEAMGLKLLQCFEAGAGELKARRMLEEAPSDRTKAEELKLLRDVLFLAKPILRMQEETSGKKGRGRPKQKRLVARYLASDREVRFEGGTSGRHIRLKGHKDGAFRFLTADGEELSDEEVAAVLEDIAKSLGKSDKSD